MILHRFTTELARLCGGRTEAVVDGSGAREGRGRGTGKTEGYFRTLGTVSNPARVIPSLFVVAFFFYFNLKLSYRMMTYVYMAARLLASLSSVSAACKGR